MAFVIELVGLVNVFGRDKHNRTLLLPDGRQSDLNIPPHVASIVVLETQLVDKKNWDFDNDTRLDRIGVRSFPIDWPSTISISGLAPNGRSTLDASAWDGLVPLLRDKTIEIVPEKAATIAQIPIAHGRLEAFFFGKDSVVGRLTVNHHAGLVTISAKAADGQPKTLNLLDGAAIVIANLSKPGSAPPRPGDREDTHFRLYGKLDRDRRSDALINEPEKDPRLQHLPSGHPYLAFIRANAATFPARGCSATGGP